MAKPTTVKQLVFTIEYRVDIEPSMEPNLAECLEQMNGYGSAAVIDVRVQEAQA